VTGTDPKRRRSLASAALASAAFAAVALPVGIGVSVPGDTDLLRGLRDHRHEAATEFFLQVDEASETLVVAAAAAVVGGALVLARRWPAAVLFALAFAIPVAADPFVKQPFARPRPDISPVAGDVSRYSFPAGHAVAAAAFFGGLLLITSTPVRRRLLPVAALLIALVGSAELYLGRHYPTDLVAGWALAAAWVLALNALREHKPIGRLRGGQSFR
jgi:membrane-associated phospholipid phosphatase